MTTKAAVSTQLFSLEAYLALEEKAVCRHEFHNGKIVEMAGGTDAHSETSASGMARFFFPFSNTLAANIFSYFFQR